MVCLFKPLGFNVLKIIPAGAVNVCSWKRFQCSLAFHELISLQASYLEAF